MKKRFFTTLLALVAIVVTAGAQTKEAYAEVSTDGTTLTFYYNAKREECLGTTYDLTWDDNGPGWYEDYGSTIATATFEISFDDYDELTNIYGMFAGLSKLYTINHLEYLHTDNVTNMFGLFAGCESLTSLNLSSFNTSKVTNMYYMFSDCGSLTELNLSSFNTSLVTNMSYMFYGCKNLESLNLSSFNTSKVTDMSYMFSCCESLTSLDLSRFDTSKVTDMSAMFSGCNSLTSFDLSRFDTSKVTDMSLMFAGCNSLTSLDLSNFNTSKVTNMGQMFNYCNFLKSLNLSNFDTSEVTEMYQMFAYCPNLKTIVCDADWYMGNMSPYYSVRMFYNCRSLVGAVSYSDSNANDVTFANPKTGYFTRQESEPEMLVAALVPSNGEPLKFEVGGTMSSFSPDAQLVRFPKGSDLVISPYNRFPGSVVVHLYINGEDRVNDLVDGEYGDKELHLQNVAEDILVEAKYELMSIDLSTFSTKGGETKVSYVRKGGVATNRTIAVEQPGIIYDMTPNSPVTFTFRPQEGYELGMVLYDYARTIYGGTGENSDYQVQLQDDGSYQFVLPANEFVKANPALTVFYKKIGADTNYDVNNDGFVTITDAVLIVNQILNQ